MARTRRVAVAEQDLGPAAAPGDAPTAPRVLTAREKAQLHGLSLCSLTTIRRWERGYRIQPASRARLEQAARQIGIAR